MILEESCSPDEPIVHLGFQAPIEVIMFARQPVGIVHYPFSQSSALVVIDIHQVAYSGYPEPTFWEAFWVVLVRHPEVLVVLGCSSSTACITWQCS